MNGLQVYRNYIENIVESAGGHVFAEYPDRLFGRVCEIDELEEADAFLKRLGKERAYIKDMSFLEKPVDDESMLERYLDLGGLSRVLDGGDMLGIEDEVLERCGGLCDPDAEVNYLNIGIENFDLGDDPSEIGEGRLKSYEEDIRKFFDMVDGEAKKVQEKRKRVEKRWVEPPPLNVLAADEREQETKEGYFKEDEVEEIEEDEIEFTDEEFAGLDFDEGVKTSDEESMDSTGLFEKKNPGVTLGERPSETKEKKNLALESFEKSNHGGEYLSDIDESLAKIIIGVSGKVEHIPGKVKRAAQEMHVKGD